MSVEELLDQYGTTYAEQAGIRLRDKPAPLYQLLVLSTLLSAPIRAETATKAARELFHAGYRTPAHMKDATWQQRVDALGRGGYVRYDETTATRLGDGAELLLTRWSGDLRRIRDNKSRVRAHLQEFPGIGEVGADIFCREAQAVWPELRPCFDKRALDSARQRGLPHNADELAGLVRDDRVAVLAAALIRADLDE
ncbi:endonuclease [Kutzneria viridogrisea]|uniref:Endonuclease n=2 Tax=Kutzneria TaxID=43356 RepID=W5W8D1_9PSEU|nr:endonuclease [Kutzneria albida]AHH97398.1 hypothetical protein KALB_4034 [Kutzneria albida DSM 43870]MBA8930683.1 endonuclease III [Kutzneria viridogrisea]